MLIDNEAKPMRAVPGRIFVAVLATLVALLAVFPEVTQAQPASKADRETMARTYFAEGKYQDAVSVYAQLYAETMHPTYLRNIARCYQNMGEPDRAIASFREYLRKANDITPAKRAEIEGFIAEMEALKRQQLGQARPAPPFPGQVAPAPDARPTAPPDSSPPADSERRLRPWGYALLGTAAVAAIAGGIFAGIAGSTYDDWERASEADQAGLESRVNRFDGAATISFVAAGVTALGGVGFFLADLLQPQRAATRVQLGWFSVRVEHRF